MRSSDKGSPGERPWLTDPDAFCDQVVEGMQRAVREAVAEHHRLGNPVAIWRDGHVGWLYPDGTFHPVNGTEPSVSEE
jgi:hypothetical protein